MQKNKPDHYNNLDKIYSKIWQLLSLATQSNQVPFHLPVFICGKKNKSDGRVVVLRGSDEKHKKIWFHTDIRSKKIKILKSNSNASFLFYDKTEKIQLRISGKTIINHQNDVAKRSWNNTLHMSRQCYLGDKAPGSNTSIPTSGLKENIDNFKYSMEESEIGYKNFCVIQTYIKSIEWLYLAAKGHRRAYFNLNKKQLEKKWLIP